jgi:hypothetical protein
VPLYPAASASVRILAFVVFEETANSKGAAPPPEPKPSTFIPKPVILLPMHHLLRQL